MIDLHVHSTFSDGTLSPRELIRLAADTGVEALALCDHNTVAGLPEFLEAAENSGVEAIPGIEFSTDYGDRELHLLGLFIRPEHYTAITQLVAEMWQRKEQSNIRLIEGLNAVGIRLDYKTIKAGTPNGQINRAVIAAEMVRLGYCATVSECFSKWLSPRHGYFVPPKRLDVFETIRFIKSIGAVAVLAHPFLNLDPDALRTFLPLAKAQGLDGMEVYYPKFDPQATALAEQICAKFHLLKSGGSDFHGTNKPDIALGTGRNNLDIPHSILEELKIRSEKEKNLLEM